MGAKPTIDWANLRVPVPIRIQIEAAMESVPLARRKGEDRDLETEPTHESEYKSDVRIREERATPVIKRVIGKGRCGINDLFAEMPFLHQTSSRVWLSGYMLKLVKAGVVLGRKVPSKSGPAWEFYKFIEGKL